ncbi:hypothetical protein H257_17022 [Aphanomyces astaci]|uniref:Uncharacterized protein n=1 Tax=Aphanomyces astaci TaxID=112090 RepID=W4FGH3_APHAT|nr:hypothetical protein H257_17022 [Aphanomyces astaci]ETV66592.1 hypothetical protein H257_17022 [Aphanomyces astaci]|eukprot:XP_009843963.1 hypothetical protein H257_17022 [Aphanomyces astaci]
MAQYVHQQRAGGSLVRLSRRVPPSSPLQGFCTSSMSRSTVMHALVAYYFLGIKRTAIARLFSKSVSTISNWIQQHEKTCPTYLSASWQGPGLLLGGDCDDRVLYRGFLWCP